MKRYEHHVCGAQGFGLQLGDVCPRCMMDRLQRDESHVSGWAYEELVKMDEIVQKLIDRAT